MRKLRFKMKVRPGAMIFVMWMIFLFLVLELLASFNIINLTGSPIFFPTVIGLFLLLDQGIMGVNKGFTRPKSILGWILTVFGFTILAGVVITVLGITVGTILTSFLTFVTSLTAVALLVSLLTE